ncbi:MAG: glycosyltransferase family 39 protein [Anaerolineae bacterium]
MPKRLLVPAYLAVLILLAFAVRTYDLDGKSIWSDEGLSLYRAREPVPSIVSGQIVIQGIPTQDTQPPLYFLLLHALMSVAGTSTYVAKYLSVLASLLIIPLLYVLGRRLMGNTVGLLAAMIGALSPLYLWYAQEIRMYTLLVALSTASMYTLIRAVGSVAGEPKGQGDKETRRQGGGEKRRDHLVTPSPCHPLTLSPPHLRTPAPQHRWGLAYFVVTAAMVYTHYSALFLVGFQGLYLVIRAARRRRWWLLAPVAVAGLVTLPVIPFVVKRLGIGPERDFHFVPLWIIVRDLWNAFSLGLSVDFYHVYPLDIIFLGVLVVGLLALLPLDAIVLGSVLGLSLVLSPVEGKGSVEGLRTRDERHRQGVAPFLLGYLFVPILALYAASHIKPMYQGARHLMIVSPAYYLMLSAGLLALRRRARPALVVSTAVIVIGMGLSTSNYFTDSRYLKDDLRGLAYYFQAHQGPNDALILSDSVLTLAFQYYLGEDASIDAVPRFGTPLQSDFPNQIRALIERYDRLWFMSPHRPVRAWLDRNLFQSDEVYFEGMDIPVMAAVYECEDPRLTEAPDGLRGETTELGGLLAFHGYTVPHNPVSAGEILATHLYWEPQRALDTDYQITLALMDDIGNKWGDGDSAPFRGLHPTSTWEPGTVLRNRHELMVNPGAPPGVYHLQLHVYDPASGDILPRSDGSPLINLGDIEIVRPREIVSPRAVTPGVARDISFGRRLRLLGFDLAARVRRPGDDIPLATYWQALGDLNRDYQLWVRLVGADGQVLAEKTVAPTSPGYPTSQWRPDDVLQGQHRLIVPADAPAGSATVVLSVVDPDGWPLTAHRLRWLPVGGTDVRLAAVEIVPYDNIVTEAPPMQYVLNAQLSGTIDLLGYDLRSTSVAPGEELNFEFRNSKLVLSPVEVFEIELYWRASTVVDGNFKVTVQVLSADDQVVAQHDSVPADWTRPTMGWLPREVIADSHTLAINSGTSPGAYRLIAAMYDPVSNRRLPVMQDGDARDHVVLGTLVVH